MKRTVAIDIGTYSVKLVELENRKGQIGLARCGKTLIIKDDVKTAIKDLISLTKLHARHIIVSLSGPSVIVRYVDMPPMNKEELLSAIRFDAEKYIPFDINDAVVDCALLNKNASGITSVLVVAARKNRVIALVELFKEVGVIVDNVTSDSVALINAFQRIGLEKGAKHSYAVLNIGAVFSNLNIFLGENPRFTRDIIWGGIDLTTRIKDAKGISLEEAELIKSKPGDEAENLNLIIMPFLEKFASEVQMSFDYFEAQFGKQIERLYISGGSAYLFSIVDFLKDNLSMDVRLWNPFEGINTSEFTSDLEIKNTPAQFAVAVGLALK